MSRIPPIACRLLFLAAAQTACVSAGVVVATVDRPVLHHSVSHTSDAESVHRMSVARLADLTRAMERAVSSGAVPGVVTLVHRNGVEVHSDVIGARDLEAGEPLSRDTIFRIHSMSKPVTSVAAMILVEEGTIGLASPVSEWLPELAHVRVLRTPTAALSDTEPVARAITVRDLLTHTSGLAYGFTAQGPLRRALRAAGLDGSNSDRTPDEFMAALGRLPLDHQPGTAWLYSLSDDVLGVLIERASGVPFPDFLRTRIFEPLGMKDTGFWVPAEKLDRLAVAYLRRPKRGGLVVIDRPSKSRYASPPSFASGGGGLVSTADDYMRFARMFLGGGALDGVRILSRESIERMTTDSLTAAEKRGSTHPVARSAVFPGSSYGLGMRVATEGGRPGSLETPGTLAWGGAAGTSYFVDPARKLAAVLMVQVMGDTASVRADFDIIVHQAVTD